MCRRSTEDIYRELGFDIEVDPSNMDTEVAAYLARVWQGRWVAIRGHRVIAAGDTIAAARAAVNDGARFSVLHVRVRAAAETADAGPTLDAHGQSQSNEGSQDGANDAT